MTINKVKERVRKDRLKALKKEIKEVQKRMGNLYQIIDDSYMITVEDWTDEDIFSFAADLTDLADLREKVSVLENKMEDIENDTKKKGR